MSTIKKAKMSSDFQVPSPKVKLQSSDGKIFQVEIEVAHCSMMLKGMLETCDPTSNDPIAIPKNAPNITGTILDKIIQWADYHKADPVGPKDDQKDEKPTNNISSWDAEFLEVDETTLFQLIRAAKFLIIDGLLEVTCKTVAKMIKGKSAEEVRQTLSIVNDFSAAEEEQVSRENAWWTDSIERYINARSIIPAYYTLPDHVKNADEEADQVNADCVTSPEIVGTILEHFPDTELLQLSFVNKLWKDEARKVMKTRGNSFAHLEYRNNSYENFKAFGKDLRQMNVVPFSGISISLDYSYLTESSDLFRTADLEPTYEAILDRLTLKELAVDVDGDWQGQQNCPELLLIKRLLRRFRQTLETLSVCISFEHEDFYQKISPYCDFPCLKILKLELPLRPQDPSYSKFTKKLLSHAPNLQELHNRGDVHELLKLLEGSSAVLVYDGAMEPIYQIPASMIARIRLEVFKLLYGGPETNLERFNRITPILLRASCTALREVKADAVLAVSLMCYAEVCFKNVKKLEMMLDYGKLDLMEPRILRMLKDFDFNRIFPSLEKVHINALEASFSFSPDHMNKIFENSQAVFKEPLPFRALNIKHLYLQDALSAASAPFFAEMFPNIEKLQIDATEEEKIPFGSIWKHWMNLKELEVELLSSPENLDSVFCGIFPEEVSELRLKDEEYLKKVQIVPVMPAISCLKKLRTCTLRFYQVQGPTLLLSKVTGLITFARCKSLTVKLLTIDANQATIRLKPYGSVFLGKR